MSNKQPTAGTTAPGFDSIAIGGPYPEETRVEFSNFKGRTLVLYFYPKDDTPGCTKQACGLRDGWQDLSKKATVFGVSVDTIAKHRKFIDKYDLPFPLLSDPDHKIAEAFGVWVEKKLYGKTYMGTERTTFVIGPDGIIKAVLPKVKPDEHLGLLLGIL
ncbi:MAG: thioredoxin-dependent thiol peroxidase [Akkermansiaceae bacterium]|nr:thioredoxin-dependent thiol peroxidase [Akkermansiaceae bacterium]MCP5546363.1 thioredoxin-dependent thiol peroxidase [Akkermansiaceae bacterium]